MNKMSEMTRKTVGFYIKEEILDDIYDIVEKDINIKNFTHFVELAINAYYEDYKKTHQVDENEKWKHYDNKKTTTTNSENKLFYLKNFKNQNQTNIWNT